MSIEKFLEKSFPEFADDKKQGICIECKQPFSDKNTFTVDGWAETKISRMCEKCFDELFAEEDDED